MKKMFGTKLALLLVAAVLAAGALTACSSGDDGGNDGGLGGHIGENPFKGLTLVYVYKDESEEITETYSFTSDTNGVHEYKEQDNESGENYNTKFDFEYAVDSQKGMLKIKATTFKDNTTTSARDELDNYLDNYIDKAYGELDSETKSLIRYAHPMSFNYNYYEFSDNNTKVNIASDYYFGNLAESDAIFTLIGLTNEKAFSINHRHMHFGIEDDNKERHSYEAFPKFSDDGSFTAVIFEDNEDEETDTYTYRKLGTALKGTYQIGGTGTNCTGTVTFTQLPEELQGVFKTNEPYNVAQGDYGYTTYTVKQ